MPIDTLTKPQVSLTNDMEPPSLPIELLRRWEDQFFDEGENLDVLLIAAFEAGVKLGYEKCNDDHALSVVDASPATVV